MDRKLLLIAIISISIFVAGCTNQKLAKIQVVKAVTTQSKPDNTVKSATSNSSATKSATTELPKTQSGTNAIDTTNNNDSGSSKGKTYQLSKTVYTHSNITINYPQITNLGDSNKQKLINEIIKNEALKVLSYYKDNTDEVSLKIDYEIKFQGKNLLSLQYAGIGYSKGAAHPNNLLYTTNIDLSKAAKIRLADLVNADETFVNKFKGSTYKSQNADVDQSQEEAAKLSIQQFTTADLIKNFINADSLDNIGTDNQSDTFSYFTKDSIGISVGISHAAGDHAEFEIKYKNIQNNLNNKNEIWKNLLN